MKVIIVEDEKLAVDRLHMLLQQIHPATQLVGVAEGVEQAVTLFKEPERRADVVFMDIHLADGSAFEIFDKVDVAIPVIFTTAYDRYAIDAFKVLTVDYLLKPITRDALEKAIRKMLLLRNGAIKAGVNPMPSDVSRTVPQPPFKSRFLGRIGQRLFFINAADIAMISADNRIVHIVAMDKTRYLIDHTLDQLESELDPSAFFRINRSIIVHARAIEQVKPFINHRLRLTLRSPLQAEEIIVSRDRVPDFKKWADS